MGKLTNDELEQRCPNNYRAIFDDEEYEYYAVSVRQAFYLAFEHFGDECLDYMAEIDPEGNVVEVHIDKEENY